MSKRGAGGQSSTPGVKIPGLAVWGPGDRDSGDGFHSTLAIICPLLLINGISIAILWAGLAKRSKEICCSRNLVAACDFYDVRRTFYTNSYENLVEKNARHAAGLTPEQ